MASVVKERLLIALYWIICSDDIKKKKDGLTDDIGTVTEV